MLLGRVSYGIVTTNVRYTEATIIMTQLIFVMISLSSATVSAILTTICQYSRKDSDLRMCSTRTNHSNYTAQ